MSIFCLFPRIGGYNLAGMFGAHARLETVGVEIARRPVPANIVEIGRFAREAARLDGSKQTSPYAMAPKQR